MVDILLNVLRISVPILLSRCVLWTKALSVLHYDIWPWTIHSDQSQHMICTWVQTRYILFDFICIKTPPSVQMVEYLKLLVWVPIWKLAWTVYLHLRMLVWTPILVTLSCPGWSDIACEQAKHYPYSRTITSAHTLIWAAEGISPFIVALVVFRFQNLNFCPMFFSLCFYIYIYMFFSLWLSTSCSIWPITLTCDMILCYDCTKSQSCTQIWHCTVHLNVRNNRASPHYLGAMHDRIKTNHLYFRLTSSVNRPALCLATVT